MTTSTHTSFTGSIPANYDKYLGPLLFEFSAADTAARVSSALSGPARVLEIACGTGISTRHLAHALESGSEILATDLNEAMLGHAAKVNGALPGVTYKQADALDLPFDDGSFDAVVCQFGIMFFPDKAQGLQEMNRVLKSNGTLAISVWDSFEHNPAVEIVNDVITEYFETDPPGFLRVPFSMSDIEAGKDLVQKAGFDQVAVAEVAAAPECLDLSLIARGFITGNPTILEIEKRGKFSVDELIDAAKVALEAAFGPAPVGIPFQEIVFTATKPD